MSERLTLGRSKRLKRRRDFQRVFGARWSAGDSHLVVYVAPNELGHLRLGVSVGRKFGNAVRRNRVKRLIREAFRLEQWDLPPGFDVVCLPRAGRLADLATYRASVRRLLAAAVERSRRGGGAEPPASPGRRAEGQAPT